MNRARDHRSGPAYDQYLLDRQAEIDAEKAAREAAENADPVKAFQKTSDAEAAQIRELILTGYITDEFLPGVERMNGRKIVNEDAALRNFRYFADNMPTFKKYMFKTFYAAAERSDLAPIAPNYTALHNLMLAYSAYPDEPVQVVAPAPVEEVETRTPSEIAEAKYKARMTEIVVYDPIDNKGYTEFDLENKVDAKTERRLRRLMEGKIGNNNYDTYLEIKDAQFQRDQDIAARAAAEENGGN